MEIQHYEMESERLRFRRLRADDFALIARFCRMHRLCMHGARFFL